MTATKNVAVHDHGPRTQVEGGVLISIRRTDSTEQWLDFYGLEPDDAGLVTLYKAVDDEYRSGHGFVYGPGTAPAAPDWDGGKKECGGGLHFCAHPIDCLQFMPEATRFVACPVLASEISVHKNATMPQKVKAPRVAGPIYECDIDGNRVES